ncbi:glycoside hydrolase family 15 protein [Streptomyces olivaceus]
MFSALIGGAGHFAEEYDVRQRQMRGNLPQAFVHALMLECAVRLGRRVGPAVTPPDGRATPDRWSVPSGTRPDGPPGRRGGGAGARG